ncbi:MAG TPA: efflux RND transporter periplasmic adaptor subunit [Gemmataceae bacterium]|nr:efflux RND transporter periplasmic adaptor subunit [Gemmataceae bacterium]
MSTVKEPGPTISPDQRRLTPSVEEHSTPRRGWLWIAAAALVASGLGGAAWFHFAHQDTETTHLVLQGNIDVRQVNLSFKVEGRIETLAVDEGDPVKAGEVIASLEKRYFYDELRVSRAKRDNLAAVLARLEHGSRPEEIEQARAQLAQQRANLALAKSNLERGQELVEKGGISKEDLDVRRETVSVGEANVKYAEQALRLAEIGPRQEDIDAARAQLLEQEGVVIQEERRLADSDLVAPNDGIILTRAREKGAIVQAGETVFTLTLASPVWVRTYVNERDLGRIRPNMAAEVRTDSAPNKVYTARIGFISPTAEFTPKTVETRELRTDLVYRLRVVVDNPDGGLRQGMPVTVTLDLSGGD